MDALRALPSRLTLRLRALTEAFNRRDRGENIPKIAETNTTSLQFVSHHSMIQRFNLVYSSP